MPDTPDRRRSSSRRRDSRTSQIGVVGIVAGVIALACCALLPVALYSNVVALVDGYRAAHDQAGTPGTVTIVQRASGNRGSEVCRGDFTPADGGPSVSVVVELPGRCVVGERLPARLTAARSSIFTGYDEPRAWVAGSSDWVAYLLLTVLFGMLTAGPLFFLVRGVLGSFRKRRQAREG